MVKTILFILHGFFVLSAVLSAKVTIGGKDFTHISRFASRGNTFEIDEFNYFISINPNTWSGAENDCRSIFGENTTLVAIETVEEWEFLKVKLENFRPLHWTGGMYNPSSGWVWSPHSQPFPPFAPWDEGHPPSNPNALHRVSIAHFRQHQAFWRSAVNTELNPYICENINIPQIVHQRIP